MTERTAQAEGTKLRASDLTGRCGAGCVQSARRAFRARDAAMAAIAPIIARAVEKGWI
jgi:hypothetical protein